MEKTEDLRKKDKKELLKMVENLRERLRELRFKLAGGKLKNFNEIREIKREIARILTIIKEKNHA